MKNQECKPIGVIFVAIINLLIINLSLVVLISYLVGGLIVNQEEFNPIKNALEFGFGLFDKTLKEDIETDYIWPCCLGLAIEEGLFGLNCFLLIVGVLCERSNFIVPWIIHQVIPLFIWGFSLKMYSKYRLQRTAEFGPYTVNLFNILTALRKKLSSSLSSLF